MKQFVNLNLFICIISLCTVFLTNNYTLKAQKDIACLIAESSEINRNKAVLSLHWERHPSGKTLTFKPCPNEYKINITVKESGTSTDGIICHTDFGDNYYSVKVYFFKFPSVGYFGEVQCVSNVKSRNYLIYINKDNVLYTKGKIEATYVEIADNNEFYDSHSCILPNHGKLSYKDFAGNKITESYRKKFYYRLKFKM
ncbi:MAG: hypothetical protein MI739_00570, partial [Bacteroidales bacterium]|nr:hypothetical protein [Bacteroidales bacterium]